MGGISSAFGYGIGYILSSLFVGANDADHPDEAKENILNLCYFAAIAFTVGQLIALALFKEMPPLPPTYTHTNNQHNIGTLPT